jgi:uncharacterized membrane protein
MPAMNAFTLLLERHPLVFFHLVTALGALVIGAVLLIKRKGNVNHRVLGWIWVVLMGSAALSSLFIGDSRFPNLAGFSPIHLLVLLVAWHLPRGIWQIRRGDVAAHRATMKGLFTGACIVAGLFTLLPGRFLGQLLWTHTLGVIA